MKFFDPAYWLALIMNMLAWCFWVRDVDTPKRRQQFERVWTDVWSESGWSWAIREDLDYKGVTVDMVVLWFGLFPVGTVRLIASGPGTRLPILKDHGISGSPFGSTRAFQVNLLSVHKMFRRRLMRSVVMLKIGQQSIRWAHQVGCRIGVAAIDARVWRRMKKRWGEMPVFQIGESKEFESDGSVDIPLAVRLDELSVFAKRTARPLYWFLFGSQSIEPSGYLRPISPAVPVDTTTESRY